MSFLHNFSFLRLKFLLVFTIVFVLPACSGGGGAGDSGISSSTTTSSLAVPVFGALGVNWTAPLEREDVTPLSLSEIAGYHVYYGTEAGDYQNQLDVESDLTAAQVPDLLSGTYYVVVTAIDTDGRESLYSSEVVVSI